MTSRGESRLRSGDGVTMVLWPFCLARFVSGDSERFLAARGRGGYGWYRFDSAALDMLYGSVSVVELRRSFSSIGVAHRYPGRGHESKVVS